jgi:poly(beta-D-mannuronate) lyase
MKRILILLVGLVVVPGFLVAANATDINLAYLYGTATQSSDYTGVPYPDAGLAIDNDTDGVYWNGSVTHTGLDNGAWWQVDLGNVFNLDSIVLWNRADFYCCSDRLTNFHVSVLDSVMAEVWGQDLFIDGIGYPDPSLNIQLPGSTYGQFVKVQLNHENYLSLAEVQVFESTVVPAPEPGTMILLGSGLAGIFAFRKKLRK